MTWKAVGFVWLGVVVVAFAAFIGISTTYPNARLQNKQITTQETQTINTPQVQNQGEVAGVQAGTIPEPANAFFQRQESIQEGGVYRAYDTSEYATETVNNYSDVLESAGWTILRNSTEEYTPVSAARLTAQNGGLFLMYTADSSGDTTSIDLCIWSGTPKNLSCGKNTEIPISTNVQDQEYSPPTEAEYTEELQE